MKTRVIFTAEPADVKAWKRFSKRQGLTLSAWICRTLNNTLGRIPSLGRWDEQGKPDLQSQHPEEFAAVQAVLKRKSQPKKARHS